MRSCKVFDTSIYETTSTHVKSLYTISFAHYTPKLPHLTPYQTGQSTLSVARKRTPSMLLLKQHQKIQHEADTLIAGVPRSVEVDG
jgi:hypothetical protein